MKIYVEYYHAQASHSDLFYATLNVAPLQALRLWISTFAESHFLYKDDRIGNNMLRELLLTACNNKYVIDVDGIHLVRLSKFCTPED